MDLKDKLSHKWRQMTLIAGVVLLSSMTVQAQNTSEQNRKETPKAYFSPKQLASALSAINADDKQADIFLEAYLQKLDPQGQISPGDLVQVFKESGIDKDEAVKMSEVLLSPQKQPSSRGYDFGSYDLSFAIDGNGNLSSLIFNGDKKLTIATLMPCIKPAAVTAGWPRTITVNVSNRRNCSAKCWCGR